MADRLFQEARQYVQQALQSSAVSATEKQQAVDKAKNALSSAFANSTMSQKQQLSEWQEQIDQLE